MTLFLKLFHEGHENHSCCELLSAIDFEFKNVIVALEEINRKKKEAIILKPIYSTLSAITISTNRGIIFTKLIGTHFEKEYFPIIDPKSFIEKYLIINIVDIEN